MSKTTVKLLYGKVDIYNLQEVWIQPLSMSVGYALCYKDDIYDKKIIYRSSNKPLLRQLGQKLTDEIYLKKDHVDLTTTKTLTKKYK